MPEEMSALSMQLTWRTDRRRVDQTGLRRFSSGGCESNWFKAKAVNLHYIPLGAIEARRRDASENVQVQAERYTRSTLIVFIQGALTVTQLSVATIIEIRHGLG